MRIVPHFNSRDGNTAARHFGQYTIEEALTDEARAMIKATEKLLENNTLASFGPEQPGSEQYLRMRALSDDWLHYERVVICPYLAWPNSSLPTVADVDSGSPEPDYYYGLSDELLVFEKTWKTKERDLTTLKAIRAKILASYQSLPDEFPFPKANANYADDTPDDPSSELFNRALRLEFYLRGVSREKASAIFKHAYPRAAEVEDEETGETYFLPNEWSDWYKYHFDYYLAAAKREPPSRSIPDYKEVQKFEKTLAELKMSGFLDRWRKRLKAYIDRDTPDDR